KSRSVLARSLILAMPRRSLELLDQTGPVFDPPDRKKKDLVRKLIRSVTPIPLFKLYLCYDRPWWEEGGVREGQSVTDLPIQQCDSWAVQGRQPGAAAPANTNAVILATYDDTLNVGFWDGLSDPDSHRVDPETHLHYVRGSNEFADRELRGSRPGRNWARW